MTVLGTLNSLSDIVQDLSDKGKDRGTSAVGPSEFRDRKLDFHHPLANLRRQHEDLAVAHPAGAGDFHDPADDLFDAGVVDPEMDFDLRQKGQRIFAALVL